jgi:hypothetical protein
VRRKAERLAEYSKKMEFTQSCDLSKLCERDIANEMLMEIVSCLYECGRS